MRHGIVKWFNDKKGFGFVQSDGKDYFIHYKEITGTGFKSLKEGDSVNFTPSTGPKGMLATQLSVGHPV